MACLASNPKGVCFETASRSMSPVAKWHKQYSSLMKGDWVPFPHPGGPAHPITNMEGQQFRILAGVH